MSADPPKPDASKDDVKPPVMRLDAGRTTDRETIFNASRYLTDAANEAIKAKAARPPETRPEKGK